MLAWGYTGLSCKRLHDTCTFLKQDVYKMLSRMTQTWCGHTYVPCLRPVPYPHLLQHVNTHERQSNSRQNRFMWSPQTIWTKVSSKKTRNDSVCVLDFGVVTTHQMLTPFLPSRFIYHYPHTWGKKWTSREFVNEISVCLDVIQTKGPRPYLDR